MTNEDFTNLLVISQVFDTLAYWWRLVEPIWSTVRTITSLLAAVILVIIIHYYARWSIGPRQSVTMRGEQSPIEEYSIAVIATQGQLSSNWLSAQLIDLAVRNYIRIYEMPRNNIVSVSPLLMQYEFELLQSIDTLKQEEQALLRILFKQPAVGAKVNSNTFDSDTSMPIRFTELGRMVADLCEGEYGLTMKDQSRSKIIKHFAIFTLVLGILSINIIPAVTAGIIFMLGYSLRPLTAQGLFLRQRVKGLKTYISTTDSDSQCERLFPYAIIFSQEQKWRQLLRRYYQTSGTHPTWYIDTTRPTFDPKEFSKSLHEFIVWMPGLTRSDLGQPIT